MQLQQIIIISVIIIFIVILLANRNNRNNFEPITLSTFPVPIPRPLPDQGYVTNGNYGDPLLPTDMQWGPIYYKNITVVDSPIKKSVVNKNLPQTYPTTYGILSTYGNILCGSPTIEVDRQGRLRSFKPCARRQHFSEDSIQEFIERYQN